MSFEEDLTATIRKAKEEKEAHVRGGCDFDAQWSELRQSRILPLFRIAAEVLSRERVGGKDELTNGSIVLRAGLSHGGDRLVHELKFKPDREQRMVVCSSSLQDDKEESFTLDNLTSAAIEMKIRHFSDAVARGEQRPKHMIGGFLEVF